MKALVAYHNEKDDWCLWAVHGAFNDVVRPLSYFNMTLEGRYLYPKIIEINITNVIQGEGNSFTWQPEEPLPEMPKLQERIRANIAFLKNYLNKH